MTWIPKRSNSGVRRLPRKLLQDRELVLPAGQVQGAGAGMPEAAVCEQQNDHGGEAE